MTRKQSERRLWYPISCISTPNRKKAMATNRFVDDESRWFEAACALVRRCVPSASDVQVQNAAAKIVKEARSIPVCHSKYYRGG